MLMIESTAVWLSNGYSFAHINHVTSHELDYYQDGYTSLSCYLTSHLDKLCLAIPPGGGAMSTGNGRGQR